MTEQKTFQNKIGKIVKQDQHTITIEDEYGKPHTLAKEPGGKIHGMLEGTGPGDCGKWNKTRTGFCIYWKTTKPADKTCTVKTVGTDPLPTQEVNERAEKAGFVVTPGVVDIAGDAIERAQKRVDERKEVAEPAKETDEQMIARVLSGLPPSETVGYRINLSGMINSVIEIHKLNGEKATTEEIKKEAVELFLWSDLITSQRFSKRD